MTIKNIYAFISTHTATLIVSLLTIALAVCDTQGQSMTEVYESGHLDLTAGETITPGNNWQRLNDDWDAKAYGKLVGRTKSMAVGADGSIYVCSKSAYRIDKLDSRGQLVVVVRQRRRPPRSVPVPPDAARDSGRSRAADHRTQRAVDAGGYRRPSGKDNPA